MLRRKKITKIIGVLLALCVSYEAYPRTPLPAEDPFAAWPKVLLKEVDDVAQTYVDQAAAITAAGSLVKPIDAAFNRILVYAIADAMTTGNVTLRTLEAHQYMGETAQTDKQVGSTPNSGGTTSAIEKPGLINLIGLAIERGAIQKAVNGTSLTLSTSPYALAALSEGDTATTYKRYGKLARIGVSATYTITDESQLLANLSRKQLDQFSVRIRLSPDRSTRSEAFESLWNKQIKDKVQRRLIVLTDAEAKLFVDNRSGNLKLNSLRNRLQNGIHNAIVAKLQTFAATDDRAKKVADVRQIILDVIKNNVYDKNLSDLGLNDFDLKMINEEFIPNLVMAHQEFIEGRALLEKVIDELNQRWLVTFIYTNHPVEGGPGYSEFKLAATRGVGAPFKFVLNASGSIYHKPDMMKNQERFKDFTAALSFEYAVTPGYLKDTVDLSKITYSLTGNYQRIQENRDLPMKAANIGVAQFKAEFPISNGVSIPLSVSYATATELIKEDHVRGNFGISFDLDKFSALAKKVLKP